MSEKDRQRRLGDALNLNEAIRSLVKVSDGQRINFVHDRLVSAIDDICEQHHKKGNSTKFSDAQIDVLKDIAFQIVYILDPKNQKSQTFFQRLGTDFKKQTALRQVGLVVATLTTLSAAIAGFYTGTQSLWPILKQHIFIMDSAPHPHPPDASPPGAQTVVAPASKG